MPSLGACTLIDQMKQLPILLFLLAYGWAAQAQLKDLPKDYWKNLEEVTMKNKFDREKQKFDQRPQFGRSLIKLDGKKIYLQGYIIPATLTKGPMVLSRFSYAECFFCGAAGPETVIEVVAKGPIIYRMDKPIILEGRLRINRTTEGQVYDPFRLLYILEEATYYSAD